ncbi:hypothetical protein GOP47_0009243 [Adiantum capillus-veneris]|uniref:Uncharacterized protein n=1 Tax=Adiantum capillus-veneris TaxID=13818 RepID=A0A9D4UWQ3_ADICA|nr:hypothetical protein GOP47_0009243 [Adiantum capillus-veneris]
METMHSRSWSRLLSTPFPPRTTASTLYSGRHSFSAYRIANSLRAPRTCSSRPCSPQRVRDLIAGIFFISCPGGRAHA